MLLFFGLPNSEIDHVDHFLPPPSVGLVHNCLPEMFELPPSWGGAEVIGGVGVSERIVSLDLLVDSETGVETILSDNLL